MLYVIGIYTHSVIYYRHLCMSSYTLPIVYTFTCLYDMRKIRYSISKSVFTNEKNKSWEHTQHLYTYDRFRLKDNCY